APEVLWDVDPTDNAAGAFPALDDPALIDPSPAPPVGVANPNPFPQGPRPFEKVEIDDDGDVVVTITIDDPAKGSFVPETLGGSNGFVENAPGSGVYQFSGTPTTASEVIANIVYLPNPDYLFPPGQPGRTDFTITASDASLNATTQVLPIVLISDSRNFLITSTQDNQALPGTLRHALVHAKNNDVITFALPTYPAVIRLSALEGLGTLRLDRHLTLLGPGSDMLTISGDANANGVTDAGDVQLLEVFATVRIKGLTLSGGFAGAGGAAHVGQLNPETRPGDLILEDCVIRDCLASFWGGAVDVEQGSFRAERCLFENNGLGVASGLGGGAISLWTDLSCHFENCTFSGNSQGSPTGYGGGAIYAESYSANAPVQIHVTHCTFAGNSDVAGNGSSIHSNVAHTEVILSNSLFGDGSSRNLKVAGFGEILSEGGNLSDDNTSTSLIQGGDPAQNYLLDDVSDQRATDPQLAPISSLEGPTRGYRPLPTSPAIGRAIPGVSMVDQRGVIRTGSADVGAVDASALGRVLVHEVFISKADASGQFIEFLNPRDQGPVDLSKAEVRIDGVTRYTFPDSSPVIHPGFGFVLAANPGNFQPPGGLDLGATPVFGGVLDSDGGLGLTERGVVQIFASTDSDGLRPIESASYVAVFVNENDPAGLPLNFDTNSVTLAPQAQGAAFVPNWTVKVGPPYGVDKNLGGSPTSPGKYAGDNTPFGESNARPFAAADRLEISEDELAILDVLGNDVDADGS
ncbi:MAG: choice-of-anchor Q domain-containing protein, partial [Haloferula sp.]